MKCFNKIVQSAVNVRRERKGNPTSGVLVEKMTLLVNSSYGYQVLVRSRHTATNCFSYEKLHGAIENEMFKRLGS